MAIFETSTEMKKLRANYTMGNQYRTKNLNMNASPLGSYKRPFENVEFRQLQDRSEGKRDKHCFYV